MSAAESEVSYELSHQYLMEDFASKYRELVVSDLKSGEEFVFKSHQKIFQSGNYKGKRIVEVGSGPTIHRLAIPSKYYDEIITSDYASDNIKSLKKWVDGDSDALDWTPVLEGAAKIEGHSDVAAGVKEIQARLREKIKSVVHCDVLKESIFDTVIGEVDLLMTGGCLEGVCPSPESFATAVKNLGRYIKTGGHLLMYTYLGMSLVDFYGKDIKVLSVTEDFVTKSIKEAGFAIEHRFYNENDTPNFEFDGNVLVIAKKL